MKTECYNCGKEYDEDAIRSGWIDSPTFEDDNGVDITEDTGWEFDYCVFCLVSMSCCRGDIYIKGFRELCEKYDKLPEEGKPHYWSYEQVDAVSNPKVIDNE